MSNNSLVSIPQHIYKWQSLTSLVLQNNNIKNFPPEMGFLNLKTINIAGNPTMLLKNNSANKGAAALMNYLRERVVDKVGMEKEVAQLQNNLRDRQKTVGTPLPKKPTDLQEYEFVDPFKQKAVEYNKKHDERFGEVYEEDVKSYLEAKRSPQSHMPQRMDEETPQKGAGFGRGAPYGANTRGNQEPQSFGFGNSQPNTRPPMRMDEERPLAAKPATRMEPETGELPEVAGKIGSRFGSNHKVGEGMGIIGGSSQFGNSPGQRTPTTPSHTPNPHAKHPTQIHKYQNIILQEQKSPLASKSATGSQYLSKKGLMSRPTRPLLRVARTSDSGKAAIVCLCWIGLDVREFRNYYLWLATGFWVVSAMLGPCTYSVID